MEKEIVTVEVDDYGNYTAECPHCHNIIDITFYTQCDEVIEDLESGEITEIYCDKCESYFEAQLA